MQNEYQSQIQEIIEKAMTEKTFSLEIIEKIRDLKVSFLSLQKDFESLQNTNNENVKLLSEIKSERDTLRSEVATYRNRETQIANSEKDAEKMKYELDFQKQRANEIKEIVGLVFRNPVLKSSSYGSVPCGKDNYGNTLSGSRSEEVTQTVE